MCAHKKASAAEVWLVNLIYQRLIHVNTDTWWKRMLGMTHCWTEKTSQWVTEEVLVLCITSGRVCWRGSSWGKSLPSVLTVRVVEMPLPSEAWNQQEVCQCATAHAHKHFTLFTAWLVLSETRAHGQICRQLPATLVDAVSVINLAGGFTYQP